MKNLLITFSGGRTSAFMTKLIKENPKYKDYNILTCFANTGKENEETLKFVDRCDKEWGLKVVWLECLVNPEKGKGTTYKIVDFNSASRNGKPFEDVIKKYGLPSKLFRHCTREMKENPIHKYAKEYFKGDDYLTALGIRADEKHRLTKDPMKIYPLADLNFTEEIIRSWWDKQSFDLNLKDYEGNCDLCFLKSKRKRLTLLKNNPSLFNWWYEMESEYGSHQQPIFDVRGKLSLKDLIKQSKQPFKTVEDKHELSKKNPSLFDLDMDLEFDCFCKNT